jgi:hypothetical protein
MQKSGERYLIIKIIFGISLRDKYLYIIEDPRRHQNEAEAECLPGGAGQPGGWPGGQPLLPPFHELLEYSSTDHEDQS